MGVVADAAGDQSTESLTRKRGYAERRLQLSGEIGMREYNKSSPNNIHMIWLGRGYPPEVACVRNRRL